ncbi:MAG: hypothetical protein ACR2FN_12245 [Chitinophagaceae bacterium]
MEKRQQLEAMDKMLREFEDLKNSQTSILKKIAQIEADNINLGIQLLEKELPDIHEQVDASLEKISALTENFQNHRDEFVRKNKLDEEVIV